MTMRRYPTLGELRRRLYELLDQGGIGSPAGRIVDRFIVVVIVVNLMAMICESVPEYADRY